MIRQKTLFLSVCVLCVFVACGNSRTDVSVGESYAPRVRLVKDAENLYHFQWDAPLKEERIILYFVRWAESGSSALDEFGFRIRSLGHESHYLVYFPAGVIVSKPAYLSRRATGVEILSAHERDAFPLPAYASDASVGIHYRDLGRVDAVREKAMRFILREHPFKPYRLGVPSRIAFAP